MHYIMNSAMSVLINTRFPQMKADFLGQEIFYKSTRVIVHQQVDKPL